MVFGSAELQHIPEIYKLWKTTKQRILGIEKSVNLKMVYVLMESSNKPVVGFIRVVGDAGRTLDYLKVNEIYIDPLVNKSAMDFFFIQIDSLINGFGYCKADVLSVDNMENILCSYGWYKTSQKFKFSNSVSGKSRSYSNFIHSREVHGIHLLEERFGELII
jgi:hypothetical protein